MSIIRLASLKEIFPTVKKIDVLYSFASIFEKLAAKDQVATNRTLLESFPAGTFSLGETAESYKEKILEFYYQDILLANFEKFKNFSLRQGLSVEESEEKAKEKARKEAEKRVNKSISSHSEFLEKLKELNISPNETIIAPGAGVGNESVLAPEYNWRGLEYQPNSVSLYNSRNEQMGIPGRASVWSFLNVDPEEELGENWEGKINFFPKEDANPAAMYAKHACGGLTDASMKEACKDRVPKILLATCCADRYTEVSWRVLNPVNDDGSPMSYESYKRLANLSKNQSQVGVDAVEKIDNFREKYLLGHGYNVERGRVSNGPYIKAWL